jgi:hypothetical protein
MTDDPHWIPDRNTLKKSLLHYREAIREEIQSVKHLMALLMKGTKMKWSQNELQEIKAQFAQLGRRVPVLMVFLLPGGLVLLPILVEVLERRRKNIAVIRERRKS